MTIYFNNSGSESASIDQFRRVKRIRRYVAGNWYDVRQLWYNPTGSDTASISDMVLIHETIFLTISASTLNYNIFTQAGSPATPVTVIVTVNAGVSVGSSSTGSASLQTGSGWHASSKIYLNNYGNIYGKGGAGGRGGQISSCSCTLAANGSAGGDAVDLQIAMEINNQGVIGGGGGGGGGGGSVSDGTSGFAAGSGGGGGGYQASSGGVAATAAGCSTNYTPSQAGSNGSSNGTGGDGGDSAPIGGTDQGGAGGAPGVTGSNGQTTGVGAGGGAGGGGLGAYGGTGGTGSYPGQTCGGSGGSGGAPGKAVEPNGNSITWVASGTLYGAIT